MASPTTSMASLFKEPQIRSRMTTRSCHGFTSQSRHTSLSPCRPPRTWCSLYGTQFVASSMTTRPRAPFYVGAKFQKIYKGDFAFMDHCTSPLSSHSLPCPYMFHLCWRHGGGAYRGAW
jgi:hypothetical protein